MDMYPDDPTEELSRKCLVAAQIEMARLSRICPSFEQNGFTADEWALLQSLPAICRPATTRIGYRELRQAAQHDLLIDSLATLPGLARVLGYHLVKVKELPSAAAFGSLILANQHATVMQAYAVMLLADAAGIPLRQPGQSLSTRMIVCDGTPVIGRSEPSIRQAINGCAPRARG